MSRFYVASKSHHAPMWRELRDQGYEIVSSWIDSDGSDLDLLWERAIAEASSVDYLIAFHVTGEEWKGAFVEIGACLGSEGIVLLVGAPPGSWTRHPRVLERQSLLVALADVAA